MTAYQIVLADDHIMLRQGIRKIIEASPDMEVVGEVNDGLELLDLLKQTSPEGCLSIRLVENKKQTYRLIS